MDIKSLDDLDNRNAVLCAINTALDFLTDPCLMMDSRSGVTRQRLTDVRMELMAAQEKVVNGKG